MAERKVGKMRKGGGGVLFAHSPSAVSYTSYILSTVPSPVVISFSTPAIFFMLLNPIVKHHAILPWVIYLQLSCEGLQTCRLG